MFKKLSDLIKNFFKEVIADIKKFKISNIFTDLRLLTIFILSLCVFLILIFNMDFFLLLKGVVCVTIFYFVFLWKK